MFGGLAALSTVIATMVWAFQVVVCHSVAFDKPEVEGGKKMIITSVPSAGPSMAEQGTNAATRIWMKVQGKKYRSFGLNKYWGGKALQGLVW